MMGMLLAATLAEAGAGYAPPPEIWYQQAVACGASALAEKGEDPTGEEVGEMMTWGLIMAETGRKTGRTKDQVDSADLIAARPFVSAPQGEEARGLRRPPRLLQGPARC